MSETPVPDWLFFLPPLWIVGWIAASVVYRRMHGKPIFPRTPDGAVYNEWLVSGANNGHWLGRIGGANRSLMVAVTNRELVITPFFPFNLLFLPEIYGLEIRTPVSSVRTVEERRWFFRDSLILGLNDGRSFRLILRNPEEFRRALKVR